MYSNALDFGTEGWHQVPPKQPRVWGALDNPHIDLHNSF